jgi:hypothetical protein
MDIPVSLLNKRMAVQVPTELPLGLVFVVGKVEKLALMDEDGHPHEFYLLEANHYLRCRLTDWAAHEVGFKDGDLVRAGGHLAFDPQQADYYLLSRDVEILEEFVPGRSTLSEIVAESRQQPQIAGLAAAELPTWVKQMAPPEIQEELLATAALSGASSELEAADSWEALEDTGASMAYPTEEPALAGLSDDLIDFLSEAMDSSEDVEVTSELISIYERQNRSDGVPIEVVQAGASTDDMTDSPELVAEELSPAVSDVDNRSVEAAVEDVAPLEPDADTPSADSGVVDRTVVTEEADPRSGEAAVEDALVTDQVRGEAESARRVDRPVRRRRRREEKDKIPWLLVVVAVILFLIFLAVIVIGLFFS